MLTVVEEAHRSDVGRQRSATDDTQIGVEDLEEATSEIAAQSVEAVEPEGGQVAAQKVGALSKSQLAAFIDSHL